MDRMVKIGDLQYEVKYPIGMRARADIERATGKAIQDAFMSGQIHDQAAIIWVGLKHREKKLTIDKVIDLMAEHEAAGGDCTADVVKPVFSIAFADRIMGINANYDGWRKLFEIDPGEEGKAPA